MIKILHLTTDSKIAGAEKLLLEITDHYDRNRYELLFCTIKSKGDFHKELLKRNQINLSLDCRNTFHVLKAIYRLVNILRRENIDILHTHLYHATILGNVVAKMFRVPLVIMTRHYSDLMYLYGSRLDRILDKFASYNANHIIAISQGVKRTLVELDAIDSSKITIISNGISVINCQKLDDSDGIDLKQELGIDNSKIVGAVSSLHLRKGHQYLIEAAAKVCEQRSDIKFLIVGDGQLNKQLQLLSHRLNLSKNIIFTGYRKDVYGLISIMDILVQPSIEEGFGIAILEAMAMGKPVIGTAVGGIPEIIKNGINGILVPPKDPLSIYQAIQRLLNNPDEAKRMGCAGKDIVQNNFSVSNMVKKYEELYENLYRGIKK